MRVRQCLSRRSPLTKRRGKLQPPPAQGRFTASNGEARWQQKTKKQNAKKGMVMEKIDTLESLLVHELKDLYHAEKQLVKALPKVVEKASNPQLKSALEEHFQQTEGHVNRLEQVFEMLGEPAKGVKCKGMEGILDEGEEVMKLKGSDRKSTRLNSSHIPLSRMP